MALLTDKQEALAGTVRWLGMPTNGACLRGVMGVYLDRHALVAHGFVSNHRMQLSKRPLRVGGICLASATPSCHVCVWCAHECLSDAPARSGCTDADLRYAWRHNDWRQLSTVSPD